MKPKRVAAVRSLLGTRSHIHYEPRGTTLIISPWNYPFTLSFGPLVSALAAGNTAIIKPSEMTPHIKKTARNLAWSKFLNNGQTCILFLLFCSMVGLRFHLVRTGAGCSTLNAKKLSPLLRIRYIFTHKFS